MAAYAVHVGLNRVDPAHYNGWAGVLRACENDARDMAQLTARRGFSTSVLLTAQATSARLLGLLRAHSSSLRAGDTLVVTFAGHGAQVRDLSADEPEGLDETWLLFDRMLIDDEIHQELARFRTGVRVVVVADSCHSGTSVRSFSRGSGAFGGRAMPPGLAAAVCAQHAAAYADLRARTPSGTLSQVSCDALLLAACQDTQLAADGVTNGLFTGTLKQVWNAGRFSGSYVDLMRAVSARMPSHQRPGLLGLGQRFRTFALEAPFAARATAAPNPVPGGNRRSTPH